MVEINNLTDKAACAKLLDGKEIPSSVKAYLSSIGAKGGRAGRGKSKARTSAQAREAAYRRWSKVKPEAQIG